MDFSKYKTIKKELLRGPWVERKASAAVPKVRGARAEAFDFGTSPQALLGHSGTRYMGHWNLKSPGRIQKITCKIPTPETLNPESQK